MTRPEDNLRAWPPPEPTRAEANLSEEEVALDEWRREREPILPDFDEIALTVDDILGEGGRLSDIFPGYRPRPQQIELARAVMSAIEDEEDLLGDAPTGVGKSLAYLIPAAIAAQARELRVLVATSTISLQSQLLRKDLPLVARLIPGTTFGVLKGVSNYACARRLDQAGQLAIDGVSEEVSRLVDWAGSTQTGDREELDWLPSREAWSRVSVDSSSCRGRNCAAADRCWSRAARSRAVKSTITVTNYAMLFRLAARSPSLLGRFHVLVCDEAHHMAELARDAFGFRLTAGRLKHAARHLPQVGDWGVLRDQVARSADELFDRLPDEVAAQRKRRTAKERVVEAGCVGQDGRAERMDQALQGLAAAYETMVEAAAGDIERQTDLENARVQTLDLAAELTVAVTCRPGWVYYIETEKSPALCASLLDPSTAIADLVFAEMRSSIQVSATLATGDGRDPFGFAARESGALQARRLAVQSPFDFRGKVALLVPRAHEVPDPREEDFVERAVDYLAHVIDFVGGSTLALFTSYRVLEAARDRLRGCTPYRLLVQGEASREHLMQEFATDVESVLLGTSSFWTGVDVPGEALRCVVMDKFPFPSPSQPVVDAISELDPESFTNYSVPLAVRQFRQGFGRLVRREDDRGLVVCMDRRIRTKRYGGAFRRTLPKGVEVIDDIERARAFVERVVNPDDDIPF